MTACTAGVAEVGCKITRKKRTQFNYNDDEF